MAHLVPVKQHHRGGDVLLHRQQCAVLIAVVLSNWAELESVLALLLMSGLHARMNWSTPDASAPLDDTPRIVLDEIDSIHTRLTIVDKALFDRISSQYRDRWDIAREKIRRLARRRNIVVHTGWGVSDEYPHGLLRDVPGHPMELWTEQDFRGLADDIRAARGLLYDLWTSINADSAAYSALAGTTRRS